MTDIGREVPPHRSGGGYPAVYNKPKWKAMIDALVAALRRGERVHHASATEAEAKRVFEAVKERLAKVKS
jgi:hypothetical protein